MRATTVVLLAGVVLSGCGDAEGPPSYPRVPATVTLESASSGVLASVGDTRTFTAIVKDDGQTVIDAPTLTWTTNAPDVVALAPSGTSATITALRNGTALITVKSGTVESTVGVSIRQRIASVVLTSPVTTLVPGTPVQLSAHALDARNNAIPEVTEFAFTSSNPDRVAVSPAGVALGLPDFGDPNVTVTASVTQSGATFSGSVALTVGPLPLSEFDHAALALSENVVPVRVPTLGIGVGYFSTREDGIWYSITWSRLSGPATEIHLHGPSTDLQLGDVLVDVSPIDQSQPFGTATGIIEARHIQGRGGQDPPISLDSLAALMNTRQVYLDVHTSAHPAGEVRGQVDGPFSVALGAEPERHRPARNRRDSPSCVVQTPLSGRLRFPTSLALLWAGPDSGASHLRSE